MISHPQGDYYCWQLKEDRKTAYNYFFILYSVAISCSNCAPLCVFTMSPRKLMALFCGGSNA